MTNITVIATVRFDYDPRDGLVATAEEAEEDVRNMIDSGDLSSNSFEFVVTEED